MILNLVVRGAIARVCEIIYNLKSSYDLYIFSSNSDWEIYLPQLQKVTHFYFQLPLADMYKISDILVQSLILICYYLPFKVMALSC